MKESDYLKDRLDILDRVRAMPVFDALDEKKILEILALCKIRKYEAGEEIIAQGVFDHWMFLMIQGRVAVVKDRIKIGELRRLGDVFGEMAIIDGSPRNATVKAETPTLCLAVDTSVLDRFKEDEQAVFHAVFYRVLAEKLADRLRSMNDELVRYRELFGPLP